MCLFFVAGGLAGAQAVLCAVDHYKEERDEDDTYGYGYEHAEEYACADVAACS
jgi:hypothetical protein